VFFVIVTSVARDIITMISLVSSTQLTSTSTSTSTKHKSLALRHTAQNKRCCSLVYGQTSNKKYSLIN